MIKELLERQLKQELMAVAQISYLAGLSLNQEIRELLLRFAKEELEHFSEVVSILGELGHKPNMKSIQVTLEPDELKTLIVLGAIEESMIAMYEEMVPLAKDPFKGRLKSIISQEKVHCEELKLLLEKIKKNLKEKPGSPDGR